MGRHRHRHGDFRGKSAVRYDRGVARLVLPALYRAVAADVAAAAPRHGAVLDVGTGPGRLLVELGRRRPDLAAVAGVDPSEDMVALAQHHLPAELADRTQLQVAPAEQLPFPGESFDVVVATLSAHHWSDPVRGFAEQHRVLRPGGQVRIYDLRGQSARLVECAGQAGLAVIPEAPTRLGRLLRTLLTCLVAVKRPTGADPAAALGR